MESKEVEETIKTINFIHFIIKFEKPVHFITVCFHIKLQFWGESVSELQNLDAKMWYLVFEDRWSLNAG